jgi:hypothetical protein
MNKRDTAIYDEGMEAAGKGAGLSDCPYGGRDGILWRQGLRSWLTDNDPDGSGRPLAQKTTRYDGPGGSISTRPQ